MWDKEERSGQAQSGGKRVVVAGATNKAEEISRDDVIKIQKTKGKANGHQWQHGLKAVVKFGYRSLSQRLWCSLKDQWGIHLSFRSKMMHF